MGALQVDGTDRNAVSNLQLLVFKTCLIASSVYVIANAVKQSVSYSKIKMCYQTLILGLAQTAPARSDDIALLSNIQFMFRTPMVCNLAASILKFVAFTKPSVIRSAIQSFSKRTGDCKCDDLVRNYFYIAGFKQHCLNRLSFLNFLYKNYLPSLQCLFISYERR